MKYSLTILKTVNNFNPQVSVVYINAFHIVQQFTCIILLFSFTICLVIYIFLVPEYDVTSPFAADEHGSFLTYSLNHRWKRNPAEDSDNNAATYHYIMDVSGEQLHLQVKRNTKFMATDLQLETHDKDGRRITKPVSRRLFVTGKVASDSDSVVALSVTDGLVRTSFSL